MNTNPRVRYAPSPTGQPHIGNIRTALFNWLFAKRYGGEFIVRIEDTDQTRMVTGATEKILESLEWLGINWNEGPSIGGPYEPYFQSERLELYQKAAYKLLDEGQAYFCYCNSEELVKAREVHSKHHSNLGYRDNCYNLGEDEIKRFKDQNRIPAIRFRSPMGTIIVLNDIVRGKVSWKSDILDDFVILKSDGFPTYHLASVLDDNAMKISHVLRAEEWLPSTPKHLALYSSLKLDPPIFGHLPMILGPDRSKLSKRHGATSVLDYKEMGFIPQALMNFIVLLGWSLDDKTEIFDSIQLSEVFSMDRVVKSGAIFNREKLDWMNGYYIRQMGVEQLADAIISYWEDFPPKQIPMPIERSFLSRIVPLIQERLKTLSEAEDRISFFFFNTLDYNANELDIKKITEQDPTYVLQKTLDITGQINSFNGETLENDLRALAESMNLSPRKFFGILRIAITARSISPPLFETMEILGREICTKRIVSCIAWTKTIDKQDA